MSVGVEDDTKVEARYQAALADIRRRRVFTVDPWNGLSYALVPPDPDEIPTVKECRAIDNSQYGWKMTRPAVSGRGKPRTRRPDQKCINHPDRLAAANRKVCHRCMYERRVAKGFNQARAERRRRGHARAD